MESGKLQLTAGPKKSLLELGEIDVEMTVTLRGQIAVYPAMGWWRTRIALKRYDKEARYALVVSIAAPGVDVDIYSEVSALVEVKQVIEVYSAP